MKYTCRVLLILAVSVPAVAQIVVPRDQSKDIAIWEPPLLLKFTDDSYWHPSIPKEMIARLSLSDSRILLEDTLMDVIQSKFGAERGARGDASESLLWLCLHGADDAGQWALWLESGEIDGPYIGAFQWQRVSNSATFDPRCAAQPANTKIVLPINLKLGISREEVVKVLGRPTWEKAGVLLYEHEHNEKVRGETFTSSNTVIVALRDGSVEAIEVTKTTSN